MQKKNIVQISLAGLILFALISPSFCQNKYWIEFTDKGISASKFVPGNPLFDSVLQSFSPKALKRRSQALGKKNSEGIITIEDAPVSKKYLDSLKILGITPVSLSAWQNAVSANLCDSQISLLKAQSFISKVTILPVRRQGTQSQQKITSVISPFAQIDDTSEVLPIPAGYDSIIYHYGYSDVFLHRINVPPLHAMGFDGSGVILGYLDVGFRWKAMSTLDKHHVISEYDFIFHDSSTANDSLDDPGQDGHGSAVLSIATGFEPDSLIGPAYRPDLLLAKTEDVRSERPIEEDNYAAAMEWMEKLGVDITSSSVAYFDFDSGYISHTYADMNGKTTVSAKACERAANLGVLVCTAMGNGGASSYPYVLTPADADSILSVGALDINDSIASFSSRGPTFDGRIKPDICAPGVSNWFESVDNVFKQGAGTSFATPLTSGSCALIKQAHPEASAQAIRAAILKTAIRPPGQNPDTAYGYGRLDAYNAALALGTVIGRVRIWRSDSIHHHIETGIAANNHIKSVLVRYSYNSFSTVLPLKLAADSLIYSATFPDLPKGVRVQYYIEVKDGADTSTFYPRNAPDSTLYFNVGDTLIPASVSNENNENSDLSIFPNPAGSFIIIRGQTADPPSFVLTDALGREMMTYNSTEPLKRLTINVSKFPNGMYTLHPESIKGNFFRNIKFIVAH